MASVSLRESFCFIVCISFIWLNQKPVIKANYQLFKLIIGVGYKEAIATMTQSQDHTMLNLNILRSDPRNKNVEIEVAN